MKVCFVTGACAGAHTGLSPSLGTVSGGFVVLACSSVSGTDAARHLAANGGFSLAGVPFLWQGFTAEADQKLCARVRGCERAWVRGCESARVRGFESGCEGARVRVRKGARVRGCEGAREGARVRECEGARVRERVRGCESARVRGCEGARVRGCERAREPDCSVVGRSATRRMTGCT